MSAYVRWLVAQKQQWHHPLEEEEAALGFRGWHTRGYLPHFDVPGVIQMINFHLADSLPQNLQHEWAAILRIRDERQRRIQLQQYLDKGYGACELAIPSIARRMEGTLLHDDNRLYTLLAWVIMPNHLHVLVEVWTTPLSNLVHTWKGVSSKYVNRALHRSGHWWQEDYFDRYIRDDEHFHKAVHYIENNPVKAGLVKEPRQWLWGSAKWRPEGFGLQPVKRPGQ
jgi:putative DNA methylase